MTVKELRELLATYPDAALVLDANTEPVHVAYIPDLGVVFIHGGRGTQATPHLVSITEKGS